MPSRDIGLKWYDMVWATPILLLVMAAAMFGSVVEFIKGREKG